MISDRRIAILAEDGVNQQQLAAIREALEENGIKTDLMACRGREIKGWEHRNWGTRFRIDCFINDGKPEQYDGVVIPGGALHADHLRESDHGHQFIRQLFASGKIVAAIGHGVQVLIDSGIVKGREVTAPPSVATDLKNAGAILQDRDITSDNGLLTARNDKAVEAFATELLDALRKGIRQRTESVI